MNTRYPLYVHSLAVRRIDCPILVFIRSYIALSTFPEHSTVFQTVLDNPTGFCPFLVREVLAMTSRALRVVTLISVVALHYSMNIRLREEM